MRLWIIAVTVMACAAGAVRAELREPQLSVTALGEDLAQFRREFMAVDKSYSTANRALAERRLSALESRLAAITPAQFELEIASIVALADNGHTNTAPLRRAQRYNRVPVRMFAFGSDFYVLRARSAHSDLLGGRLVSIDGHPIATLRDAARALMGGTPEFRDRAAPLFFESPALLNASSLARDAADATYVFDVDGRRVERRLAGEAPDPAWPATSVMAALYPDPGVREPNGWRGLLSAASAPWALREPAQRLRWRDAPEIGGLVVEFRQNVSSPGHDIAQFTQGVERELRARQPANVVLDMRLNGGGDLNTTRDFMRRLPSLVTGRVFVLTSPSTFSAAISSVGYLKQAAPAKVTIVGEVVGDRLEFWAEGRSITLAHSGIVISRATERHDYANGCKTFRDCHGSVVRHPIAVRTLAPDIAAPWTIEAYRAGSDPAMDAVALALK
jgi:hypothetical protein